MRTSLSRAPLRDDVYGVLTARIRDGRLPPGAVLRDTELAASLGVSRTPVREALIRLHQDGLVDAAVGRGFRVSGLEWSEVQEIYPIIWTLEALALRSCPVPGRARGDKLGRLNQALGAAKSSTDIVACDDAWHDALLADCPNAELTQLIHLLKRRMCRYDLPYMTRRDHVKRSVSQHAEIIGALKSRKVDAAADLLIENWRTGMRLLESWLAK